MGFTSISRILRDEGGENTEFINNPDYGNPFKQSTAAAIGGQILVVAILVLFLTIVFILCLYLYAKFFSRRRDGRSRSRNGLIFAPDFVPAVRRGLEPSVIQSIPVVLFSPNEFKDGLECAVCLCELSDGEKARLLPKCNHGFHVDCIDMWFHSHSTCPLCRNPVAPESTGPVSTDPRPGRPEIQIPVTNQETMNFPTNVLFWGTQDDVSTGSSSSEEEVSSSTKSEGNGMLVIDIPRRLTESFSSSSIQLPEGETSSPTLARLRSLKRLLSRGKRAILPSPRGGDIEQGVAGGEVVQSTKTPLDS
ncbi:RING-H2 finger protein ATL60-like [Magnolia sinica]|uniref:RING-H2 finger protein ATL60-like n=1 Tax=Magnolia sinica TaxID=86752 RepID=UPI00265A6223|nr:RING-H2 finger protein ATL60-like [Magnolia sinica]